MNSLPTQAILGAGIAVLAAVLAVASGSVPLGSLSMILGSIAAALVAYVAFAAQSERLRGEERLVYRPVYARRQGVQRRVASDD